MDERLDGHTGTNNFITSLEKQFSQWEHASEWFGELVNDSDSWNLHRFGKGSAVLLCFPCTYIVPSGFRTSAVEGLG